MSNLPYVGSYYNEDGSIEFCLWAPKAKNVSLIASAKRYCMQQSFEDYFTLTLPKSQQVIDYLYCLEDSKERPDPASRWQPQGVHGSSRVVNSADFIWSDANWHGIALDQYVCYELHVGCFTESGTFEAIIEKLPYLRELGITAIELMPVIECPGGRNWGYDGTYPFAPHHAYGGPNGLKKLINACHECQLAVILDVVYNHLGPEGNYLADFGFYFTDRYKTPWGDAINFDGAYSDHVRHYFINNALYWLSEYHVDALRLDAVHAIFDSSPTHILKQLKAAWQVEAKRLNRKAYIIAESDLNDPRIINPIEKCGYGLDAQWSDDFHHSVHALLTKSKWGYLVDFGSVADLAKAYKEGFVYDDRVSCYRKKRFGSSSKDVPGKQLVVALQNHDQIANATQGNRLGTLIGSERYRLATMLLFFAPNIPLLFMGQEWDAETPFLFFTSYEDEQLAENVRKSYLEEQSIQTSNIEDYNPQNPERFLRSKLQWKELHDAKHQSMFCFYKELIQLRHKFACLSNFEKNFLEVSFDENKQWLLVQRWDAVDQARALLVVNFSQEEQLIPFSTERPWQLRIKSSVEYETSKILTSQELRCGSQTALLYTT